MSSHSWSELRWLTECTCGVSEKYRFKSCVSLRYKILIYTLLSCSLWMDIVDALVFHQLHHAWWHAVQSVVQLFALRALNILHGHSFLVECKTKLESAHHPLGLTWIKGTLPMHGCSFAWLQGIYLYTTCMVCTWRYRSHQLNNNVWCSLVRIQKHSTHLHSTITFSKCVGGLIKSNNSLYIKYMKVRRTMQ